MRLPLSGDPIGFSFARWRGEMIQNNTEKAATRAVEVIERAKNVTCASELAVLYGEAFASLGFHQFCLAEGMQAGGIRSGRALIGKIEPNWAHHYAHSGHAARDPMVERAIHRLDPFIWSEVEVADREARRVLNEAGDFGIRDGFVAPIHHLDGSMWGVSLGAAYRLDLSPDERAAAHLLALYFGAQGELLTRGCSAPAKRRPLLSPRQRECLQWARYGKTDWEISEILSISQATVIDHMAEAKRRLGVHTRTQAVIEALTLGLISL
jgi:LuxR family transcriptional regulator, quorum-sensing system regulator BjaR1